MLTQGKGRGQQGDGNRNRGGGQAIAKATMRANVMAIRVVGEQQQWQQRG
jgi:hypothetical protein